MNPLASTGDRALPARLAAAAIAMAIALTLGGPAGAVLEVDITEGNVDPLPVAIADFFEANEGEGRFGAQHSRDHP